MMVQPAHRQNTALHICHTQMQVVDQLRILHIVLADREPIALALEAGIIAILIAGGKTIYKIRLLAFRFYSAPVDFFLLGTFDILEKVVIGSDELLVGIRPHTIASLSIIDRSTFATHG